MPLNPVWKRYPISEVISMMVGCAPGNYLLPPRPGINGPRERDPASDGMIDLISSRDTIRFAEDPAMVCRPIWYFAHKDEWWKAGGPLPVAINSIPPELDPAFMVIRKETITKIQNLSDQLRQLLLLK